MQRHARSANGNAEMTLESAIEDGCAQLKFETDIRPTPACEKEEGPRSKGKEELIVMEKRLIGERQQFEIEIDITPDMSFRDAENEGCAVLRRRLSALRQCATRLVQTEPGEESESDDGEAALRLRRISNDEGDMNADFLADLGVPDDWVPPSERSDGKAKRRCRSLLETHKFLIKLPPARDMPYESMRKTACGLLVDDVDALLECVEVLTNP